MSTRSTTHFIYGDPKHPAAIVYRHSDGYPEGAGADILRFLDECAMLKDSRFTDPTYLAAKYVVFLADQFNWEYKYTAKEMEKSRPASRLEFLSVGVLMRDPGDIEYRYVIDCKKIVDGKPKVTCYARGGSDWEHPAWTPVEIPVETPA